MYERKDDISMKKTVALLLCLCVLIVFPSCGTEKENESAKTTQKDTTNNELTITDNEIRYH